MTEPNDVIAVQLEQLYNLYKIKSLLQGIYNNLSLIAEGATGQVITVNNVSLYTLAAKYYGDATAWTVIAQANGLTDPQITQTTTLTIPSSAISVGGILGI